MLQTLLFLLLCPAACELQVAECEGECDSGGGVDTADPDTDSDNTDNIDCDDTSADVSPEGSDVPNVGNDQDCDGSDTVLTAFYVSNRIGRSGATDSAWPRSLDRASTVVRLGPGCGGAVALRR